LDAAVERLVASRRPERPQLAGRLCVIPLVGAPLEDSGPVPLFAVPAGDSVHLTERAGEARVEEVQVYNGTGRAVLALEGELLEGGYQDRMISSSVVVREQSAGIVPTACSEEGRFEGDDARFRASGLVASPRFRRRLRLAYHGGANDADRPDPRQTAVWDDIENDRQTLGHPGTGVSMLRLRESVREMGTHLVRRLERFPDESGWLVFVDDRLVAADLFASARLAVSYRTPLLEAAAYDTLVDSLRSGPTQAQCPETDASWPERYWEEIAGEMGHSLVVREETSTGSVRLRFESPSIAGTALLHDTRPVHLSLYPALYPDDRAALS
jgi:hypothetical protein